MMAAKNARSATRPQSGRQEIKVLSVKQPFADLIVCGAKWCENRSWRTHYRGDLFIHATTWDRYVDGDEWRTWAGARTAAKLAHVDATGAIIGKVKLIDCVPIEDLDTVERYIDGVRKTLPDELQPLYENVRRFRDSTWQYVRGPMCFILAEPRALIEPIPIKGDLKIWTAKMKRSVLRFRRRKQKGTNGATRRQSRAPT